MVQCYSLVKLTQFLWKNKSFQNMIFWYRLYGIPCLSTLKTSCSKWSFFLFNSKVLKIHYQANGRTGHKFSFIKWHHFDLRFIENGLALFTGDGEELVSFTRSDWETYYFNFEDPINFLYLHSGIYESSNWILNVQEDSSNIGMYLWFYYIIYILYI